MKNIYEDLGCRLEAEHLAGYAGQSYALHEGVWTTARALSEAQAQTRDTFAFKWQQEATFTSAAARRRMRQWLVERYGDVGALLPKDGSRFILLDAGCGAALSALELFASYWSRFSYIGVDVSDAVHTARKRIVEEGKSGIFFRESLMELPFAPGSVDLLFSEGVLHHTDSTRDALQRLAQYLRPGGYFLFYVYNKKGPLREFTDDHIRERLQGLPPEEAWDALRPLTRLGIELGEKNIELNIQEAIPLLGIPAGKISLQRFMYWHVFKAFYDPDLTFEEMNHINFDWYSPKNAHRQSPEEVRTWCADSGLTIEHMRVEAAGITVIARKSSARGSKEL